MRPHDGSHDQINLTKFWLEYNNKNYDTNETLTIEYDRKMLPQWVRRTLC